MNRYEALKHAVRAHGADTDWGGQLYVLHPMAVADRIESNTANIYPSVREDAIVVALLHDVLEDTQYMLDPDSFSAEQWYALQLVTRKDEPPVCPKCGHEGLRKAWVQLREGEVDWQAEFATVKERGVELRGAGVEEAPGAYKRLPEVLEAMGETIEVVNWLRPVGVAMAPNGVPADD